MKLVGEIFQCTDWAVLFRPRGGREKWLSLAMLDRPVEWLESTAEAVVPQKDKGKMPALPAAAVIYMPRRLARRKFGVG